MALLTAGDIIKAALELELIDADASALLGTVYADGVSSGEAGRQLLISPSWCGSDAARSSAGSPTTRTSSRASRDEDCLSRPSSASAQEAFSGPWQRHAGESRQYRDPRHKKGAIDV